MSKCGDLILIEVDMTQIYISYYQVYFYFQLKNEDINVSFIRATLKWIVKKYILIWELYFLFLFYHK